MKRPFWYYLILYFCILVLITIVGISFFFESRPGQKILLKKIETLAKREKIDLVIPTLESKGLFAVRFPYLHARIAKCYDIEWEDLSIRLSIFSLIKKEIAISSLFAKRARFRPLCKEINANNTISQKQEEWIDFPFTLAIHHFHIDHLEYVAKEPIVLQTKGKGKITKGAEKIIVAAQIIKKEPQIANCKFIAAIRKKDKRIALRFSADIPSLETFSPFLPYTPYDMSVSLKGSIKGDMTIWQKTSIPKQDLLIALKGKINRLKTPYEWQLPLIQKDWTFQLRGRYFKNKDFSIDSLFAKNPYLALKGNAYLNDLLSPRSLILELFCKDLSFLTVNTLSFSGPFYTKISKKDDRSPFYIQAKSSHVEINSVSFENFYVHGQGILEKTRLKTTSNLQTIYKDQPLNIKGTVIWPLNKTFSIPFFEGSYADAHFTAQLQYLQIEGLQGKISAHLESMKTLQLFFPPIPLVAQTDITVQLNQDRIHVHSELQDLRFFELVSNLAYVDIDWEKPLYEKKGEVRIELFQAKYQTADLEHVYLKTSNEEENWPYEITLRGVWKKPFDLLSQGFWRKKEKEFLLTVQECEGSFLGYRMSMPKPIQIEKTEERLVVHDFTIDLIDSFLSGSLDLRKDNQNAILVAKNFPLDFISLMPWNFPLSASATGHASFRKTNRETNAKIALSLDKIKAIDHPHKKGIKAQFDLDLSDHSFTSTAKVHIAQEQILEFSSKSSIEFSLFPYVLHFSPNDPLEAVAIFDGKIEEILDFFDLGNQKIEGDIQCQLTCGNTISNPKLQGAILWKNGLYENFETGTLLKNITAHLHANDQNIFIETLEGTDKRKGNFHATGKLDLISAKRFPYHLDILMNNLQVMQTDYMTIETSGKFQMEGTINEATAKGNLEVTNALFSIPEKISSDIPELDITFINQSPLQEKKEPPKIFPSYPIHLDIELVAKDNVFIEGRGLHSRWQGDLKIEGTYTNINTKGTLELIRGDYQFSGRIFTLTQGTFVFTGIPNALPFLNISAATEQRGIQIIANLQGPLNSPKLTFDSLPHLPLSAIMSILLFGKDISEISGVQAISLAATVASLSDSPNILETTRKSLGIDRFVIVTSPVKATDDVEKVAVQVGKYITKGVLVSLSQGMEQGSSNIIVEVDLKHGFIFQAETRQEEEQSQFTLKWNLNY